MTKRGKKAKDLKEYGYAVVLQYRDMEPTYAMASSQPHPFAVYLREDSARISAAAISNGIGVKARVVRVAIVEQKGRKG